MGATGNIIVTDKKVTDDKVTVEGVIKANVIYKTTDEEVGYSQISGDIPFTVVLDINGAKEGMKAIVNSNLEAIDASIEANTEFISDVIELDEEPKKKKASITIYVVTKGDTLWSLAKKYNTTVDAIVKMNSVENPDSIEIGDKLIIPGRAIF